jgi:hypothetical protein
LAKALSSTEAMSDVLEDEIKAVKVGLYSC